jgi:hypothetical protein
MAIGAPLPRELRTFLDVGAGSVCGDEGKDQQRQQGARSSINHGLSLSLA